MRWRIQNPIREKPKPIFKCVILIGRQGVHSLGEITTTEQIPRVVRFVRHHRGRRWILDATFKRRPVQGLVIRPCVRLAGIVAMDFLIEEIRSPAQRDHISVREAYWLSLGQFKQAPEVIQRIRLPRLRNDPVIRFEAERNLISDRHRLDKRRFAGLARLSKTRLPRN